MDKYELLEEAIDNCTYLMLFVTNTVTNKDMWREYKNQHHKIVAL